MFGNLNCDCDDVTDLVKEMSRRKFDADLFSSLFDGISTRDPTQNGGCTVRESCSKWPKHSA